MTKRSLATVVAVLAVAVVAAACGRSTVEPPGHALLGIVEILDRSTVPHTTLATWTYQQGWDEDVLITLSHATEPDRTRASVGVRMWNRGGSEIALVEDGEYSARYGIPPGGDPDDVIDMDPALGLFHGDHVHIYGYHEEGRTGTAQVIFALWHDGHSDGETTPIDVVITD
jgi:hypothetical protein